MDRTPDEKRRCGASADGSALTSMDMVLKATDPRRKVLVFKSNLLPLSETFIKNQVLSYQSWRAALVGMFPENHGLALNRIDTILFHQNKDAAKRDLNLLARLRIARWGHVKALRAQNAALLHVHFATEAVMWWPLLRRLNLPTVVTLHGQDINVHPHVWKKHRVWSPGFFYPERLTSLAADPRAHFVAVSHAIKSRAIEFGLPADRIAVCYIGVNRSDFLPADVPVSRRARRILFVGRFVEKKGAQFLIEAYSRVRTVLPDAELVMIGNGPLFEQLQSLAKELRQPVEFTGSLPHEDVKRHMGSTRVLCAPSITAADGDAEGLPTVIPEAQACGLPVVTSARGGAMEGIRDGETGLAFREKDVESLANHLTRLLADDSLAESMSRAATGHAAEAFDIHKCTRRLEARYDEWMAESRPLVAV